MTVERLRGLLTQFPQDAEVWASSEEYRIAKVTGVTTQIDDHKTIVVMDVEPDS